MANTVKVQGSKTVARARKGDTGNGGITYRITVWEDGKEYRNDSSLKTDGERIIDIAVNKAMSLIGDTTFKAFKCMVTHTSDTQSRPLAAGTYWEAINTLQPIVTPVLLANTIAANFIDVDELKVKHLDGADGDFDSLEIRPGGSITTSGQAESTSSHVTIDNEKIEYQSSDAVHGTTLSHSQLNDDGLSVRYKRTYTGINIDKTLFVGYDGVSIQDDVNNEREYAVFCNGSYKLAIVSSLPSSPSSNVVYIVTSGTGKGVYVGSTKIT